MKKNNLINYLIDCQNILTKHEEKFWSNKIENVVNESNRSSNFTEEILSWYGGMGSINDLLLLAVNGHNIKSKEEDKVNKKLKSLISKIYNEVS